LRTMPTPLATAIVRTAGMSAAPRAGGPGRRQRREKMAGTLQGVSRIEEDRP